MVKLVWEGKDPKFQSLKNLDLEGDFQIFEKFHSVNSNKIKEISNRDYNELYWGDNSQVINYLLKKSNKRIDLIYLDPPFFSGSDYVLTIKTKNKEKNQIAYKDKWNNNFDDYLEMIYQKLLLMRKILTSTGLIFVHLDWHANHYVKVVMDEIFGENNFINNIVWYYYNKYSASKTNLPRAHDDILVYSKSKDYTFNKLRIPRDKPKKQLKRKMVNGVLKNAKDDKGNVIYRIVKDKKMDDVWKIPCMQPASKQWTGYPTQKHHKLLDRIIRLGSNEGDLIADFFCGSGTTIYAAEKLNRRWIGCDSSRYAIYLTRKRLINLKTESKVENDIPFFISTKLTDKRKKLIESGFFEKEIQIKRKK